jgi:hypothetical protein
VNLTLSELTWLPLPAAVLGRDSELVARTPEWPGAGPGTTTFRVRGKRLLVAGAPASGSSDVLLSRLLATLDDAAAGLPDRRALQVRMLATSLRLIAGRDLGGPGRADQVVHFARAGIESRTALRVEVEDHDASHVMSAEAVALVLVQLAVNAERHAHARTVRLRQSESGFHAAWMGNAAGRAVTSRRRDDRSRWGLGFARVAADALGGVLYAPHAAGSGHCVSTLELGVERLALPLATLQHDAVVKATRAWDEETGLLPGSGAHIHPRLEAITALARETPGAIRVDGGWSARAAGDTVWVAVVPDGAADRARDVVDGIAHERALWDGVAEPLRTRIAATAALLGHTLGAPLDRAPPRAWERRLHQLAGAFALAMPVPECPARGALDPQVTALLAAEVGDRFDVDGDTVWLRLRPDAARHPLALAVESPRRGWVPIA